MPKRSKTDSNINALYNSSNTMRSTAVPPGMAQSVYRETLAEWGKATYSLSRSNDLLYDVIQNALKRFGALWKVLPHEGRRREVVEDVIRLLAEAWMDEPAHTVEERLENLREQGFFSDLAAGHLTERNYGAVFAEILRIPFKQANDLELFIEIEHTFDGIDPKPVEKTKKTKRTKK